MKKLLHCIACLPNIISVFFSEILLIRFCNHTRAFFGIIKCFYLLMKKPPHLKPLYGLEHYYPDPGRLSQTKGYKYNADLDLSVIIPMYNTEKFIEECLNSIVSQKTDYTYEIILVDDGSGDRTAKLVAPYLGDNIKLISQENSGQSVARNNALYESRGRYIMFTDSDDILLPGAIQSLMDAAVKNSADIAEGNVIWFSSEINEEKIKDLTRKPHIESYAENPKFVLPCNGYSVAKVYRRELWDSVRFPEGYIFEDTITRFILRRKANKVVFTGKPVYGYRRNPGSSTHSGMTMKMLDIFWVFGRYIEMCKEQNMPFDRTFYMMALVSIGINSVALKIEDNELKLTCFYKICEEYDCIKKYKCGRLPVSLKLLEKSLIKRNMPAWEHIAKTIIKCNLIKSYRENL